ncbi:ABC transporter ATP-binding protein [Clostridium sp. BJN0001]|uniref:ABC transporter ATP-binding protein n=1 Tax=Clostridium sp. BJN0001 TaxID=2930219 RepID=UPI001FCF9D8F|nr:ABC transporter ATP-binding protein [Clostridium sp. BJN0001]
MDSKKKSWIKILLSHASQCKGKMIFSVIFSIISILSGLMPYICIYKILGLFIENTITTNGIIFWSLIAFIGCALKQLFFTFSTMLSHISAYTILETIRIKIADKLVKAPLGSVMSKTIGELKSLMLDEVEAIEPPLAHMIPEGAGNIVLPIAVWITVFIFDFRMALASIVTIPITLIIFSQLMKDYDKNYTTYMKYKNHVNSVMVEYIEGIEVVKAFGQTGKIYGKYSDAVYEFKNHTLSWLKNTWVGMKLAFAVAPSTLIGTLPIGLLLYSKGILNPAEVSVCIMLSIGMVSSLARLEVFGESIRKMAYTLIKTNDLLEMPELEESTEYKKINKYDVKIDNIHFSYTGKKSEQVINGIDLNLKQGLFTALVGPSGSGKSTVAKLIARFFDVDSGKITIGGINIKEIPLKELSKIVSFVTQDNFLFNCSLKENIRLGNPKATDEEVYKAAKMAQCDEFVKKLANGYDTNAGDAGKQLSGGEKQRIAIARVMLKNSPIIILDEATAFTDPENEEKLQKSISALTKGKTLLVIAHRLSTIQNADQIVIVKDGKIVDKGKQDELLRKSPLYLRMWKSHIGAKSWAISDEKGDIQNV